MDWIQDKEIFFIYLFIYVFIYLFIYFIHLFICAYIVWAISPPCLPPLPSPLQPSGFQAEPWTLPKVFTFFTVWAEILKEKENCFQINKNVIKSQNLDDTYDSSPLLTIFLIYFYFLFIRNRKEIWTWIFLVILHAVHMKLSFLAFYLFFNLAWIPLQSFSVLNRSQFSEIQDSKYCPIYFSLISLMKKL
jgi:hypothetical protein